MARVGPQRQRKQNEHWSRSVPSIVASNDANCVSASKLELTCRIGAARFAYLKICSVSLHKTYVSTIYLF